VHVPGKEGLLLGVDVVLLKVVEGLVHEGLRRVRVVRLIVRDVHEGLRVQLAVVQEAPLDLQAGEAQLRCSRDAGEVQARCRRGADELTCSGGVSADTPWRRTPYSCCSAASDSSLMEEGAKTTSAQYEPAAGCVTPD